MNDRVSLPLAVLLVLTCGALAFFIYYGQWFPPTLAVRFTLAGVPYGWMDRLKFIVIGSSLSFMLPTFVVACLGVMPRVLPIRMVTLPHRDYWLAPERREATLNRLLYFALWLGCLVQAFLLSLWIMIRHANPPGAPARSLDGHTALVAVFVLALVTFVAVVSRAFAKPR